MKSIFTSVFLLLLAICGIATQLHSQSSTEVVIIEQPKDVIECEGSLDQYLFVVAAPMDRSYKIAYRWWKDGRPYSDRVEDFGQLTFDALKYSMSGEYRAELFAFDPNWTSAYGNPFSYDSSRVSPIVFSEPTNLYVLQQPSFIDTIPLVIAKKGTDVSITFDANVYGEHNMDNPTYRTGIQWYKDSVALQNNDRINGVQSSILTINNIIESDYNEKYRVRLTSDCDTIWSNEFGIYDEPTLIWYGSTFGAQPCIYDTVIFTTLYRTSIPGIEVESQWYMNDEPMEDVDGIVYGATEDSLIFYLDTNNTFDYEAVFIQKLWPKGYEHNFMMGLKSTMEFLRPPVIISDPDSVYKVQIGDILRLPSKAEGEKIFYRWYRNGKDLHQNIDTLSLGILDESFAGDYQCIAYNACSEDSSIIMKVEIEKGPEALTGVLEEDRIGFHQNYPNPFSSSSTISWNSQSGGYASMELTDLMGNKVATLLDGNVGAGLNKVEINSDKLNLSTGTYYVIFRLNNIVETKQITVVR